MDIYEQLHQAVGELKQKWPELFRQRIYRTGSLVGIDDSGIYVVNPHNINDIPIGIAMSSTDDNDFVLVRGGF